MKIWCVRFSGDLEETSLNEQEASSLMRDHPNLHLFLWDGVWVA